MKYLCQKWKVKLIVRGAYRLTGTGIVECLEIVDVGCNLKQFDGLTRLTLTPIFYNISTPLHIEERNHQHIVMKFCRNISIQDVVIQAKFGDDRVRGLGRREVKFQASPLT